MLFSGSPNLLFRYQLKRPERDSQIQSLSWGSDGTSRAFCMASNVSSTFSVLIKLLDNSFSIVFIVSKNERLQTTAGVPPNRYLSCAHLFSVLLEPFIRNWYLDMIEIIDVVDFVSRMNDETRGIIVCFICKINRHLVALIAIKPTDRAVLMLQQNDMEIKNNSRRLIFIQKIHHSKLRLKVGLFQFFFNC